MNIRNLIMLLPLSIALGGCGFMGGKDAAEKRANECLDDRIKNGGIGKNAFYSPEFWKVTTKDKWAQMTNLVAKANGDLTSYSLNTWNLKTQAHTNKLSGMFVTLVFDTTYKTGSGQETFIMHRSKKKDDFTILSHNINTPEIYQLIQEGIKEAAKP